MALGVWWACDCDFGVSGKPGKVEGKVLATLWCGEEDDEEPEARDVNDKIRQLSPKSMQSNDEEKMMMEKRREAAQTERIDGPAT